MKYTGPEKKIRQILALYFLDIQKTRHFNLTIRTMLTREKDFLFKLLFNRDIGFKKEVIHMCL